MAMNTCPDCGKPVSKAARACPHCGKSFGWGMTDRVVGGFFVALFVLGLIFLFNNHG